MQGLTLTIAMIASTLVLVLQPIYGLIIYVASFVWYPCYLSVQIGTIDFTVRRIVILAIFAKLFLQTDLPSRFKWIWLDKLVILYFLSEILVGGTKAQPLMAFLINRGGAIFDMVLPYFAVRMILQNKQQYLTLLKAFVVISAPLVIVGLYQFVTSHNPVGFLKQYRAWEGLVKRDTVKPRAGFYRANVTFYHPILYGLFFSSLGPLCIGLSRYIKEHKSIFKAGIGLMGVGVLCSLSAGPLLGAVFAGLFIVLYFHKSYWRTVLLAIILLCAMMEITSDRHFYEFVDRFTFSKNTAWYRFRLIEVALYEGGMNNHWLTGFGWNVDPGWMREIYPDLPWKTRIDMSNHYLAILSSYGLFVLAIFLAMNIAAFKRLINSYKLCVSKADKWLVWCLLGGMAGTACTLVTVTLEDQPTTIYYMMLAFAGVMPELIAKSNSPRMINPGRVS